MPTYPSISNPLDHRPFRHGPIPPSVEFLLRTVHLIPTASPVIMAVDDDGSLAPIVAARGHMVTALTTSRTHLATTLRHDVRLGVRVTRVGAQPARWVHSPEARQRWNAIVSVGALWQPNPDRVFVHSTLSQHLSPGGLVLLEAPASETSPLRIQAEWGPRLSWRFSSRIAQESRHIEGIGTVLSDAEIHRRRHRFRT